MFLTLWLSMIDEGHLHEDSWPHALQSVKHTWHPGATGLASGHHNLKPDSKPIFWTQF